MAESSESNLELDSASKNLDNTTFGLSSGSDKDSETFIAFYDTWAQDYEKDNEVLGYVGPEVGAKTLVEFLKQHGFSTECRILDVGSGTGLVGEQLKKMNYTSLDGLEPSEKSVEIAKAKKIYKTFYSDFLVPGIRLDIPSDTYDAAICIGVFTLGNVKAEGAMDEMVRVVRPGGLICFSVREDVMFDKEYGHEDKMAELCEKKAWKLLSKTLQQHLSNYSRSTHSYFFVYEVL